MWQFAADPQAQTLDVCPLRIADMHLNALPFLEPPALVHLTLESLQFNGNIIEAGIGLRHPFLGLTKFTGFDVCGILITNGTVSGFDNPELRMAGQDDTRLLNPDGWSRWWNPAEFPVNLHTMFSYNDGMLGTPDSIADYNSTLNAYKYFCDDLGPNDTLDNISLEKRGMFTAGLKNIRHYTIELGSAGLVFNYAIDACWQYPNGSHPWTAPDDFGPNANRQEAYRVAVTETTNTLYNDGVTSGGDLSLSIDVYDWFNADANTVVVESPGNFALHTASTPTGGGEGYSTYSIDIANAAPAPDSIDMLIHIESDAAGYGGLLPGETVTAYFMHTASVSNQPQVEDAGWARTWGGAGTDWATGVAVDGSGNAYTTGYFTGTADFNPDPAGPPEYRTSQGAQDTYLSRINSKGELVWAKTWGGSLLDRGLAVAVDDTGHVYISGDFEGTSNFNPDPGTPVNLTSHGGRDAFLSKLDSNGELQWAKSWGGTDNDYSYGVDVDDSGNPYASGWFYGTMNADPDPGTPVNLTSNGERDAFLSKFNPDGELQWAKAWGGTDKDLAQDVAVYGTDHIHVAGYFSDTVNLNPNPGTPDYHTTNGLFDLYVSELNANGELQWAKSWGSDTYDYCSGVAVDGGGNVFVSGDFQHTVDFNPWGTPNLVTAGGMDPFVSKFNSSGDYQWAKAWGGTGHDRSYAVAADSAGNSFISGHFNGKANLNPNPGDPVEVTSNGMTDVYLIKLNSGGELQWGLAFGASLNDFGYALDTGSSGSVYMAGVYQETVNFNPDPQGDPDNHTSHGGYDIFLCKYLLDGSW